MFRRPALLALGAFVLFLLYSFTFLSSSGTKGVVDSPWQVSNVNAPNLVPAPGAAPEGFEQLAQPIDPLPPGTNAPNPLSNDLQSLDNGNAMDTPAGDTNSVHLDEGVYQFMEDIVYPQPSLDLSTLAQYRPHNLASIGPNPTFATYFSSRKTSLHDPYFVAIQQLIYLTLWNPATASTKYPFTVFVAPFIPDEQRRILAGAGANVIELPLVDWKPIEDVYARWKDLFSKINMWNQTQFSRIALLDCDAFPLQNIDDIFEVSKPQKCNPEKLEKEDLAFEREICDYEFSGVQVLGFTEINVGATVFSPNTAMHARLLRNSAKTDQFDNKMAEQAFLNWQFSISGAFPTQFIPREYNGFFPQPHERMTLKVVHEKLWTFDPWGDKVFDATWLGLLQFYDNGFFAERRKSDGLS